MEKDRPRTAQRSRKGKRAWRKNVDIDDVQAGLEENRERLRLVGEEDDFVFDTAGSTSSAQPKKLKTHEILTNKSKIRPLEAARHPGKIQGVDKSKVHKLMRLSGKVVGESKLKARIEKDGLVKKQVSADLWDTPEEDCTPEVLQQSSSHSHTRAKVVPKTLLQKPLRLESAQEETIDGGRSYNPSLDSWKALITSEFTLESQREAKRQELQQFLERLKRLVSELEESSDEEGDDETTAVADTDLNLSINKPTTVKIKTKAQRNREKRHRERMDLQEQVKELKQQLHELEKVDHYTEEAASKPTQTRKKKAPKTLYKYDAIARPLDLKLSDELPSNLKNLKPEGNLFYDSMIKLQENGKIETRLPVAKKRKYKQKVTEKWTYKDFK